MLDTSPLTLEDVRRALARDQMACRRLVALLTPAIQARANAALERRRRGGGRAATHQEVVDYTQEVFVALFENDGRVLRSWDPARGASLPTFAGLVAERVVAAIARSGRRGGWREDPTMNEDLDQGLGATEHPELRIADRNLLGVLLDRLREALSPRGFLLFERLILEEQPAEDVARDQDMTLEALYAWRSRTKKLVAKLAEELAAENSAAGGVSSAPVADKNRGEVRDV